MDFHSTTLFNVMPKDVLKVFSGAKITTKIVTIKMDIGKNSSTYTLTGGRDMITSTCRSSSSLVFQTWNEDYNQSIDTKG